MPRGRSKVTSSDKLPTMGINGNKGIHFKFPNGYTLSVQIGPGNYCDNRDADIIGFMRSQSNLPASSNAEIAIWGNDGEMLPISDCDTVCGWYPIHQLGWLLLKLGEDSLTDTEVCDFVKEQMDNA